MRDSSFEVGNSDLDDFDNYQMFMHIVNSDQEAESSHTRNYIDSNRVGVKERLYADYFDDHPRYPEYYFRRRYRMSSRLFLKIIRGIENKIATTSPPLPAHFDFFRQRRDATGQMSFSVRMKCTSAIRQLAYGTSPDTLDEYLQMGEHCARDCLDFFIMCVIELFMPKYLRSPTLADIQRLYAKHNAYHGFHGMLGSIDCMHWEWKNCLKEWHRQFHRSDKKYQTIMLEVVASHDLWIWHAFFRVAGANNDLTVLNNSHLFDELLEGHATMVSFQVNRTTFDQGYYLADGIYPQWSSFVKSFSVANSEKKILYLNVGKKVLEKTSKEHLGCSRADGIL